MILISIQKRSVWYPVPTASHAHIVRCRASFMKISRLANMVSSLPRFILSQTVATCLLNIYFPVYRIVISLSWSRVKALASWCCQMKMRLPSGSYLTRSLVAACIRSQVVKRFSKNDVPVRVSPTKIALMSKHDI